MTAALFVKWFHEFFVKQVTRFQKKPNIIRQSPFINWQHHNSHNSDNDNNNIVTMFFLSSYMPFIQPVDQNAFGLSKMYYRKSILVHILSCKKTNVYNNLQSLNVKDAIYLLGSAWDKVTHNIIQKCCSKIWSHRLCFEVTVLVRNNRNLPTLLIFLRKLALGRSK